MINNYIELFELRVVLFERDCFITLMSENFDVKELNLCIFDNIKNLI